MKNIAVIEDNPHHRLSLRVMLEPSYRVTLYDDVFSALAGMAASRPDLVLLDVSLPETNGAEVLRRIQADPGLRGLPVIALAAPAMSGERERYLALGFGDFLIKPIHDESLLLGAIERLLARADTC